MDLSNFLKSYYSIVYKQKNNRIKQMYEYNIDSAKQNNDEEELRDMYEDIILINSIH